MLMMHAPRRPRSTGSAALQERNTPFTLTAMVRSHSSSGMVSTAAMCTTPALHTRMSSCPRRATVSRTMLSTSAHRVTSVSRASAPAERFDFAHGVVRGLVAADRRRAVLLGRTRHAVDLGDGDVGAFARQRERDPATDAPCPTGDERYLASESHAAPLLQPRPGCQGLAPRRRVTLRTWLTSSARKC